MYKSCKLCGNLNLILPIPEYVSYIFDFYKTSRFPSKNVRELGFQVPDFLHV